MDDEFHVAVADCLRGRSRTANTSAACGFDGGDCSGGRIFFRQLELLNSAAIAALLLLVARPSALGDSSFQLSFLAIGCIGGLALPWLEATVQRMPGRFADGAT